MGEVSPNFNFLFENLNQIAYIFITPTQFGPVNRKMAEFCNIKAENIEAESLDIILDKDELKKVKKFNQEVFKKGLRKKAEMEVELNTGKRTIEVDYIPHHNNDGKVDYILCLAEDITDEIEKEMQLFRNKERYRSVFEQAPLAFIVSDRQTNIMDWNAKAEEIFGWRKDEVINKNFNLIIPEDSYSDITELLENVFDGKESYNVNKNIVKDGREIYCEWNTALIRDKENKILEIISIAQDISEKLEAKEKIQFQKEELKYSELRTQFFANISHEFKTPLNLIFSSLQLIEYHLNNNEIDQENNKLDNYLESIKNNGYRLLRLVNNLIDITKIDVNSFKLHRGNFDIVELLNSIVELTGDYLEAKNRNFRFINNLDSKVIALDPFNIERVILNLISNAVKFTSAGDEILLTLKMKNDQILISLRDTGIGIKKENQHIIFEQFRQIDQSFNKKREGSGIGLSLVKSIIEMHGGEITLESVYGVFTKFNIYLPDKKIDQKAVEEKNYTAASLLNKLELEFSDINHISE